MYSNTYTEYNYMERIEEQRIKRIARTQEVRKQKILLLAGIFLTILIISVLSIKAFVFANDIKNKSELGNKKYETVLIYCGDTLESVADQHISAGYSSSSILIKEICNINHIASDEKLIAGNYIIVPYFD